MFDKNKAFLFACLKDAVRAAVKKGALANGLDQEKIGSGSATLIQSLSINISSGAFIFLYLPPPCQLKAFTVLPVCLQGK